MSKGGDKMIVKDGTYVGSLCSLIVKNNNIKVVVDNKQLGLLNDFKNYDFHFDEDGEISGSGCCVTEECGKIGENVYNEYFKEEEEE